MAMAVFRDGYEEVMRRLTGGLQFLRAWQRDWQVPTTGAISQARERLGEAPVKLLFEKVAAPLAAPGAPGAWLGHRRLMAIDGVKLDAPDTAANLAWLGRPGGLTGGRSRRSRSPAWANAAPTPWSRPRSARSASASGSWPAGCWRRWDQACW